MSPQRDEPAPLAGSARSILDAARPHERLSTQRKEALRTRVLAAVAAGAGVGLAASAAKAAEIASGAGAGAGASLGVGAAKAVGLSLFAKIGLGVAVVTIGAGSVLLSRAYQEPASASSTVAPADTAIVASPPSAREIAPSAPAVSETTSAPEPSEKPAASAPRPTSQVAPTATAEGTAEPADSLQEENKLLAAAHAELSRGNAGAALAILDQHAARFPRGTLAPERRAARAMALCKAGRTDEGRRELTALYGSDPKSPMAQKIDRACGK